MYKVQFVGLVCFYRERGARLALLPDGRKPDHGIDPHYGMVVVPADSIEQMTGWGGVDIRERGYFPLEEPCEVVIEGADMAGELDVDEHEGLPQLRQIDPKFEINLDCAETIARVSIRQGKLKSYHIPGGKAVVSELVVPHEGSIGVTVKEKDGQERFIRVKAGTEIAITNMARGDVYRRKDSHDGHFRIYEKLSVRKDVSLKEPETVPALTELSSRNPVFGGRGPIGLYINCSNTGCC